MKKKKKKKNSKKKHFVKMASLDSHPIWLHQNLLLSTWIRILLSIHFHPLQQTLLLGISSCYFQYFYIFKLRFCSIICFMFYQIQLEQILVISQSGKWVGGRGLFFEASMFGMLEHVQWPCRFDKYLHRMKQTCT